MHRSISQKVAAGSQILKRASSSVATLKSQFKNTNGKITEAKINARLNFSKFDGATFIKLAHQDTISGDASIISRNSSTSTASLSRQSSLESLYTDNGGINHSVSNDSINSDNTVVIDSTGFNFKDATTADENTITKFSNFVSGTKDGIKRGINDGFKAIDNLSKNCALMKNTLKAAMPNITHSENKQVMPKKLKSVLRGIISLPYNIAKNTITVGYKATSSSASLLKKTISHSYKSNADLKTIKDKLSVSLEGVHKKVSEKSDEIDELALVVSDVVTISSQEELTNDREILKNIYIEVENEIKYIKSDENQSLTNKEIAKLRNEKLEEKYKNHAGELKGSYHNDNKSNEELTFDEFIESTNFQNHLYFKYADDTQNKGCIKEGTSSFKLDSPEGKKVLTNKIKDNLRNKLTEKFKDEFNKKNIGPREGAIEIENKLEKCLKTVKTCEKWAINNSSDSELKEIYRQLKNNDTVGLFRDEFYELSDSIDELNGVNEEIDIIEDLENMDNVEKNSYIADKALDVVDNASNSLWSAGFTGSVFGIAPLAALCVIGGGLVMAAKGLKVVNNGMRTTYAAHMKSNNLKEAEKLGKEIKSLKDTVVKAGKSLETFVNDNLKALEEKLEKAGNDESKVKEALKEFSDTLDTKVGDSTTVGDILTEINTKTGELKEKSEAAMKHKRVATEANREAQYDTVNFLTWATFITAAGVAAQVAVEGGNASDAFGNYMKDTNKMLTPGIDPVNQITSGESAEAFTQGSDLSFDSSAAVNATVNATAYYADITLGEKIGNVVHGEDSHVINNLLSDLKLQERMLDDVLENWNRNKETEK